MKRSISLPLTLSLLAGLTCLAGLAAPNVVSAQGAEGVPTLSADEALKLRWQRLLREADERISDAQHALDSARQAAEVASRQAVLMGSGQNLAARAAAMDAQKKAEDDLALAQKAKTDLLEKARVEGVPPGYLR